MLIRISNEEDRITVAGILFKNGYVVSQVRLKQGNRNVIYLNAEEKENIN